MEIKIGIQNAARELVLDTRETAEAVRELVDAAVKEEGVLTLTDTRGRTVMVPATKLAYVELGVGVTGQVGFRT